MKNTNTTIKEIAARFYSKNDVQKVEKGENGKIAVLTENMATCGHVVITTDFDNIEYSGSARGSIVAENVKRAILPYIENNYTEIGVNFGGYFKNSLFKFYGVGIRGRWASIYSKLTYSELTCKNPDGFELQDGAEIENDREDSGRIALDGETLTKVFKVFKVLKMAVCVNGTHKAAKMECEFKGARFAVVVLNCGEFDEVEEIADHAENLVKQWDREDQKEIVEVTASAPREAVAAMAATSAPEPEEVPAGVNIKRNDEHDGTEVYFDRKPSQDVRDALKAAGYRWHGVKKCWYGKLSEAEVFAIIYGTGKEPEAGKAAEVPAESIEAPAPVAGVRDFENDLRLGDVVRIEGATGATAKNVNGVYYVANAYTYANGEKHYHLNSLKKDRGSIYEGIGKKTLYWPLSCYHSNREVVRQFRENTKEAKLTGMGPISAAVYSMICKHVEADRAKAEKSYFREDEMKRVEEKAAELARMEAENPGLSGFSAKMEEKYSPKGPGLRIVKNGLDVRDSASGTWNHYNLGMRDNGETVEIWGSYYGRARSSTIPGGFGLEIKNDSDPMTDYFDADGATVGKDHPLFERFKAAANGAKPYELTDEDAQKIIDYLEAKKAAAEAEALKEREERAHEEDKLEQFAVDAINTWKNEFPCAPGCGPSVVVQWSELGALHAFGEEDSEGTGHPAERYSVDAFQHITDDIDRYVRAKKDIGGFVYFKTKFTVEFSDDTPSLTERIDLGDGDGGFIGMFRKMVKFHDEKGDADDTPVGLYSGNLDHVREVLRRLEEAHDETADMIDSELDGLEPV